MITRIDFHPDAVAEATAARQWYTEIDVQLGDAFADELETAVERVSKSPKQWPTHLHATRCIPLTRFPYLLVYRIHDDTIQIVAVQHLKRRPGYWQWR